MEDLKNTLKESLEFYLEQEKTIISRLALLQKGNIKRKNIKGETYYYLQYRKGLRVIDEYIGKEIPDRLLEQKKQKKQLELHLKKTREAIRLLHEKPSKESDLTSPIRDILAKLTEERLWDAGVEIIGSWCFLFYQKYLAVEKYPLKTQDLDILIPLPYKGKPFDFALFLRGLGFEERFNLDGSIFYSGNLLKVEFLAPQKGKGLKHTEYVKQISVSPQLLRFLEILSEEPITISIARGIKVKVPAPACFMLHKLLLSTRTTRKDKMEKDLRQVIIAGKFVLTNKNELAKLKKQWGKFPKTWKKLIKNALNKSLDLFPLEAESIKAVVAILQ